MTRILHQFWLQGVERAPKTNVDPSLWGAPRKLWDEAMVTALVERDYPQWAAFWHRIPMLMIKCDVARAFMLHAEGGIYADLDYRPTEQFKTCWDLLPARVCVAGYQHLTPWYRLPNNAWIASPKGDPFWLETFLPVVQRQLESPSWLSVAGQMIMGSWFTVLCAAGPIAWAQWPVKVLPYELVYEAWGVHGKQKTGGWVPWGELWRQIVCFVCCIALTLLVYVAVRS